MNWNQDLQDPHRYDDLLDMPHPVSTLHPPMSRHDRAAQFAPFAALTGLGAAINETARLTERRIELSEGAREELNGKLCTLQERQRERPKVTVTFFLPDEKKDGGSYETLTGILRRIDTTRRSLLFTDGNCILWEDILAIDLPEEE